MITLALDASTYTATVAVLRGDRLLASSRVGMRGADEERLLPAVAAVLETAGLTAGALERVVCGSGPGSFTSLRIAASIAKGIASASGIPLVAVPSLALVVAAHDGTRAPGQYVATLDALRGEHYAAVCTVGAEGQVTALGPLMRWPSGELQARAATVGPVVGPGQALGAEPDAAALPRVMQLPSLRTPVDLGGWEPTYGRLAEAQVKWEAAHGRPLGAA